MPKYWDMNLGPHLWSQTLYVQNPSLAILTSFRTFWQKFRPLKTKSNCWERPGCSSQLWTEAAETSVSVEASKSFFLSLPLSLSRSLSSKVGFCLNMLSVLFLLATLLVSPLTGSPLLQPDEHQEIGRIVNGRDANPGAFVFFTFLLNSHLLSLTGLKLHGQHFYRKISLRDLN